MRSGPRTGLVLAGVAALVGVAAGCQTLPPPPPPPPPTTCDAAATPTAQSPVTFAAVIAPRDGAPHEVTAFTVTSNAEKDAKVAQLSQSSTVLAVAPNQPVHVADAPITTGSYNDFPQQWGLQSAPGADFEPAWNTPAFTGHGVTVAVVDTGVDLNHTGLAGHVIAGPDFIVDPSGDTPVTGDGYGHGTHVAGIIADNDSPNGGLGGAPTATILAVRVLDQFGTGSSASVAQGVEWAASHGAKVINLSLGAPGCDSVIGQSVTDAHNEGVVVAAAAGNDNSGSELFSPAAYSAEVIAAAATDQSGNRAGFSNFGAYVAIGAPGVGVLSTCAYTPTCIGSTTPSNTAYGDLSGTSMATPFVSAAAALIKEECPTFGPDQIKNELVSHAGALVPGFAFHTLDAGQAVAADCH